MLLVVVVADDDEVLMENGCGFGPKVYKTRHPAYMRIA